MSRAFLSSLFCCCGSRKLEEDDIPDQREDENSRLIPDSLGSTMYSNTALIDQQRLQQKLGTIVRAKERKMVNVGSQMPFNLHNQALPPEFHYTAPGSQVYLSDEYGETYHQSYPTAPYPPFSDPYDHTSRSSRSRSIDENSHSKTILNVRLVGFVDRRGRTTRRKQTDMDLDLNTPIFSSLKQVSPCSETTSAVPSSDEVKLQESGAISLSWGD